MVLGTRNLPGLPPDLIGLMDALRAGLRRDLATLAASHLNLRVQEINTSHDMLLEDPHTVATLVRDFFEKI